MTKRKVHRSAVTGEFISPEAAQESPDTTIAQTIDYPEPAHVADVEPEMEPEPLDRPDKEHVVAGISMPYVGKS